jgi:hypothetical protein
MTKWTAQTVSIAKGLEPDDVADLAVDLQAGITYDGETGRLVAVFEVDATSLRSATTAAIRAASDVLPAKPAGISVQTTEQFIADTEHPTPIDLVGMGEAAELLEMSRARIDQLVKGPQSGFPAPVARVSSGPVWTRESLEAFKERGRPLPGRPRKNPELAAR